MVVDGNPEWTTFQNVLKVFLKKRGRNSRLRRILNEDG